MNLLIVTQYFWPEYFIINDMVKTLVSQGHSVTVLTGKPNYPDGKIYDGYKENGCQHEVFGKGVNVFRAPLRPRMSRGGLNLALNYISFIWNGLRYFPSAVKKDIYDSIIVFAPSPITSAIPALYLKWKLKVHLAVWIQDLWPESLQATGFVQNKVILRIVGWIVGAIYSGADTLLVQSRAFCKPVSNYADPSKVIYFPNAFPDSLMSSDFTNVTTTELSDSLIDVFENNFCVTFTGNLGTAQSLKTIVLAAEKLKGINKLSIVLVGSGSMSSWLAEQKKTYELDNLILAGQYPSSTMPEVFARSQALLVTLKKNITFSNTIPSKVQAYLAAGKPIIAGLDGEAARIIEEAGAGFTSDAGDVNGLVTSIQKIVDLSVSERLAIGLAGRHYYLNNFEMKKQCIHLVDILDKRIQIGKERS